MQKHISYSKNNKYQYLINLERNIINYDRADNKKNFVIPAKDWKHEVHQDWRERTDCLARESSSPPSRAFNKLLVMSI